MIETAINQALAGNFSFFILTVNILQLGISGVILYLTFKNSKAKNRKKIKKALDVSIVSATLNIMTVDKGKATVKKAANHAV